MPIGGHSGKYLDGQACHLSSLHNSSLELPVSAWDPPSPPSPLWPAGGVAYTYSWLNRQNHTIRVNLTIVRVSDHMQELH
jgi:hypothetical protein